MIKNSVGKLYVGISENPKERVVYHNQKMAEKKEIGAYQET